MTISSPGIGSGLDVNSIVSQLMTVESAPVKALDTKEASYQAKISAYGSLKSALSSFQSAAHALTDLTLYNSVKTSVSDSSVLSATAGKSAVAGGSYAIEVTKLAQSQKLATTGQTNLASAIGAGTLSFNFGTITTGSGSFSAATGKYSGAGFTANGEAAKTVVIDAGHNTLGGIRDAINAANIGVTASIINVGGTTPYRLSLASTAPGEANSMKISVTGDAALDALLSQDPSGTQNLAETVSAQNAQFKIDGLAVSKPTNTITDVIPGVTLALTKTNSGSPVTVTTARGDSTALVTNVGTLVSAYNDLNKNIRDLTAYDQATGTKGTLLGDAGVRTLQTQIRAALSTALTGPGTGSMNTLTQAGLTFQKDGSLVLDSTVLKNAITTNPDGVAALFGTTGTPTDSLIKVAGTKAQTRQGSYPIVITRVATPGIATGSAAMASSITITTGVNDKLSVQVDAVNGTITLPAGTYTQNSVTDMLQSMINTAPAFASARVSVSQSSGILSISSTGYGTGSRVLVTGGSARTDLLGAAPTSTDGLDVAGTINGVAATGSGQYLTGKFGTAVEGLRLQVLGGAIGNRGRLDLSQGYAFQLDALATSMLSATGPITSSTDGINSTIKSIGVQRDELNRRLTTIQATYRAQFTALDSLIGRMTQTSSFLTQQLANLPNSNSSNKQ